MTELNLTDAQARGDACIKCGKEGTAADGQRVGSCEGHTLWACFGGCAFLTALFRA